MANSDSWHPFRPTATDMEREVAKTAGWVGTGQHADSLEALNSRGICEKALFQNHVRLETVDMNHIPGRLRGFDFTWSSCCFEHLGFNCGWPQFRAKQLGDTSPWRYRRSYNGA